MTFAFRGSCGYGAQNDEGRFKQYPRPLDEAFVLIHNRNISPFYAIIGVASAPFGDYQRNMIPATFTQLIAQIQSTIITTGINFENGISASAYLFRNPKLLLNRSLPINGGLTTSYQYQLNNRDFIKATADWIYNIATSSNYIVYNKNVFHKKSDGIHLSLQSQISAYDLLIQYVFTTSKFDVKNTPLVYAKPSALLIQAGLSHTLANEPARIGFAFHRSWNSQLLGPGGLPKYRVHAIYQYEPWKNFIFGLHGILDIDYNKTEGGTGRRSLTGIFTFRTILG